MHQASAGIACWLLDLCVPSAALLSLAFQALRATSGNDLLQLSHVLVDELWAPCVADLRAPVLDSVVATDASDCKVAAVQTQLSLKVAQRVWRHSLRKSSWEKLLSELQAWLRARALVEEELELPRGASPSLPIRSGGALLAA